MTGTRSRATFRYAKTVLAVGRTVTSTARLLDILPLLESDRRVQVFFTIAPGSDFADGVAALLNRAKVVPWEQATETTYDLAISASANGDLHRLRAPLLLIPHGAGHNKLLPSGALSGLAREQLVHNGKLTPSAIALTHTDQLATLARTCSEALDRAVVVGDPCHDRMRASGWARRRYRDDLGAAGRKIVLVSSTWGGNALLAVRPDLPDRLARELPADEYLVIIALHPNVWDFHGARQLGHWLPSAAFLPPHEAWQAAVIAADAVIGDHGSLALYATAMGVPVLLGTFADEEIAAGTPMAELGARAPRLDDRPLRAQLDDLVAWEGIRTFDQSGEAAGRLREVMYRLMELEPRGAAELPALPRPFVDAPQAQSYFVASRCSNGNIVELERFPLHDPVSELPQRHIAATPDADPRRLQAAGVLLLPDGADAERWLAELPVCRTVGVITGPRSCVVWLRDGRRLAVSGGPAELVASAVHAWLSSGRVVEELKRGLLIQTGSVEFRCAL
ncbi:hypothetical protein NLX83_25930 [Allokutzneria sp. A3M-2-11 16]|uniref:hypothetical protein n=1 Tax=Allokutzneria sp. A3M-2-11 16 TaxID=2962043 RepID=UPI0020B7539E|nr:hypothetical protein [Allokutzneria sp. A3M-2-11 16]MCP3802717.1 hypothetical protein [Allokutzneria sp. A3M-2-11 16]